MLEIIPIQTKNSLKKNIIFPDSTFPESNCEYSSYHIGKENFMYSTLITRLIRFIILISMMIGVWLGKAYGRPNVSVECLKDPIHNQLEIFNDLILNNRTIAHFFQISSSLFMDFVFFSLYSYWVFYVKSSRLIISTLMFYTVRAFTQMLLQMRFPDGYYWTYPDFPSYVVPYGETSDFFFSGHCGFLTICALEWYSIGKRTFFIITIVINIYMAFVMLIFRVHYTIDITTGIIVSHYVYMVASNNEQKINRFFTYLYVKILGYISKNPKETLKQDKEGSELSTFYRK